MRLLIAKSAIDDGQFFVPLLRNFSILVEAGTKFGLKTTAERLFYPQNKSLTVFEDT